MDVKETGCRQRKVPQCGKCLAGDSGALTGLASPCPGAAFLLVPAHTKRCATNFVVALVLGCVRSWTDWDTWSRKEAGTCGRCFPADLSRKMETVVSGI
jgi:hypothetical protein